MNNKSDYLVHYGVLGMKWGKRKDRYKVSTEAKARAQVKADVSKYGSKDKAIIKISKKAERARKAKTVAKKGASAIAASGLTLQTLNMAMATGIQAGSAVAGKAIIAAGAVSNPLLLLPVAALASGAALYATKAKGKTSKKSIKRIENIQKYA